ncbi:hypothetical protein ACFQ6H_21165 [Rhodococcus sp. NPDC056506]|uniref:hypothetical protein n=1 Tax=Rhodococcus sp. NPDC056506 TaxID=3345844 RepID=UPI00366F4140
MIWFRSQEPVVPEVPPQIELPPAVSDNLTTPPPDVFLTQPWATLAAGLLAIVAASIAFFGVWYTQMRTARATRSQLRLQSVFALRQQRQHEAQLDATAELERAKHRRQVEYDALSTALPAVLKARDAIIALQGRMDDDEPTSPKNRRATGVLSEHAARLSTAQVTTDDAVAKAASLLLIGQEDAYLRVMKFTSICRAATIDGAPFSIHEFAEASTLAIGSIRDAYKP